VKTLLKSVHIYQSYCKNNLAQFFWPTLYSYASGTYEMTLTLTLIHPASNWTHWSTLRRHPCLSRAVTSASSQLSLIFCRSWLTVLLQFALGRPAWSSLVSWYIPASIVLAVVYAGGPYGKHAQARRSMCEIYL